MQVAMPTAVHNHVRDLILNYCRLWKHRSFYLGWHCVAADVLLQQPGLLLDRLPGGSIPGAPRPLVNAQEPNHWEATWRATVGAAEGSSLHKRKHQTEQLCTDAGLLYQPIGSKRKEGIQQPPSSSLTQLPVG